MFALSGQKYFCMSSHSQTLVQRFICYSLLALFTLHGFSQNKDKPQKLLEEAKKNYRQTALEEARLKLNEILALKANDSISFAATLMLGKIEYDVEKYTQAIIWFDKARMMQANQSDSLYLWMGLAYKNTGNCAQATRFLAEFLQRHKQDGPAKTQADLEIKGCEANAKPLRSLGRYRVVNASINSAQADAFPYVKTNADGGQTLVFTSHRPLDPLFSKPYEGLDQASFSDIYQVQALNDTLLGTDPILIDSHLITQQGRLNSRHNDGAATFAPDGTVYFTICNDRENKINCNIFESRYDEPTQSWSKAILVEGIYDTLQIDKKKYFYDDRHPSLSADGKRLYFASNRRNGSQGGFDIWVSHREAKGWSKPANLGSTINTILDEYSPAISKDETHLLFSSNGRQGGFGGQDLYQSLKTETGSWGIPGNMGRPVNTIYNDMGGFWAKADSILYFTSNRPEGKGSYDIYYAVRRPDPPVVLEGLVRDINTKAPIPFATVVAFENKEGDAKESVDTVYAGQGARFSFLLKPDRQYTLLGGALEYISGEQDFSTEGIVPGTIVVQHIDLPPIPPTNLVEERPLPPGPPPIEIGTIYFDFDRATIKPESYETLQKLTQYLDFYAHYKVEIQGHTDSVGSEVYNQKLSDRRANAVKTYLAEHGIEAERLTAIGYGESRPRRSNKTKAGRDANRRTEFWFSTIDDPEDTREPRRRR